MRTNITLKDPKDRRSSEANRTTDKHSGGIGLKPRPEDGILWILVMLLDKLLFFFLIFCGGIGTKPFASCYCPRLQEATRHFTSH